MKRLTLLRHAKTERDSPGGDFDRALQPRGRDDTARLAAELDRVELTFDMVIASPARRVVETVESIGLTATYDGRLYNAPTGRLLEIIGETDDSISSLLVVGHNPAIEHLAGRLTAGSTGDFPTAALAEIMLPIGHWRDMAGAEGQLIRFVTPRSLG